MAEDNSIQNKRLLWLLLIILAVIIIAGIIYLAIIYFVNDSNQKEVIQNTNQELGITEELPPIDPARLEALNNNQPESAVVTGLPVERDISFVARLFSEKFGSYSNQGDLNNFAELDPQMTALLSNWIKNTYLPELERKLPDFLDYYGIESKVMSLEITNYNQTNGQAEVLVTNMRQEFLGSLDNPRVFYQDLKLNLVNLGGKWLVDGAYWQSEK